jgi:CHAT domain-containing protein/Tfp pilus assembly protein PilF
VGKPQRSDTEEDHNKSIAETSFAEGEVLRAEWRAESFNAALEKYRIARQHWHAGGDKREEAAVLDIMGQIHLTLSEYQKSLGCFNEALALHRSVKNRQGEVEALNNISSVYIYLGEVERAKNHAHRAHRLSRHIGDPHGMAHAINNIGEVYYFSGEIQQALETFRRALSVWPDDDPPGKAQTFLDIGYAYYDLRDMQQALDNYNRALHLWESIDDRRRQALALTAIGGAYFHLGEKQTALNFHDKAVRLFRTMGDRNGEAVALNGLGYVYSNLGEHSKALDCYTQALQLFRLIGNPEYENYTIIFVGSSYHALGETEKALEYYKLLLNRTVNYSQAKASALVHIGKVYVSMKEIRQALHHFQRALRLYRHTKDKIGESTTLNEIGSAFKLLDDRKAAHNYYNNALALSRAVKDQEGEAATLFNIARLERDTGALVMARSHLETALAIVEPLRSKVRSQDMRSSYFASVHERYELYIDILMQLHQRTPAEGFDALALRASEQARARSLLEMLNEAHADVSQGVDPALLERERALKQALDNTVKKRMTLLTGNHAGVGAVTTELDRITSEYDEVIARIRDANPRYSALTQPQPLGVPEIQEQVLDDESLLLEYELGEERSYLWAVTRTEVRSYQLPMRSEIEREALALYNLLIARQPVLGEEPEQRRARVTEADARYWQQAATLSRIVLGPVSEQLGNKRLIVVADGVLQYIPFQSLTLPEDGQAGLNPAGSVESPLPLVFKHEIVNQPSASALAVLKREMHRRAPAPKAVAVLADPVFETDDPRIIPETGGSQLAASEHSRTTEMQRALRDVGVDSDQGGIPRLLASKAEAKAIKKIAPHGAVFEALGFDASRATAMGPEIRQHRIVHFATHGVLDSEHPELSGIVLSLVNRQGQPENGFLRLHDIYNLNLMADLVVLSACSTGLGNNVKGEGIVGLTRGFMYAGASGVIASLWKVDDEATAELMKHFYIGILKEGLPPSAALRNAQLAMWQQKRWRAPYYWAAFVLQGEYNGSFPAASASSAHAFMIGGVAAAILFLSGGLYFVGKRKAAMRLRVGKPPAYDL